jgi:uncharacterized membrane protein
MNAIISKRKITLTLALLIGLLWLPTPSAKAKSSDQLHDQPVVRVIMFWLATCGHCEYVIKEVLPPLQDQYGDQLEILLIELVTQEDVDRLYETAARVGIAKENVSVPFMLVGERVLKGSAQIPGELPGLIEMHLASGGIDYPHFPSLEIYLPEMEKIREQSDHLSVSAQEETQSSASTPIAVPEDQPEQFADYSRSNGLTLARVVLAGMVLSIIYAIYALLKDSDSKGSQRSSWIDWLIPVVALVGMGVAGYMTYVETQSVEAICGPVGDCNTVQNSSYAKVLGILPVGILGLLGYAAILIAWIVLRVRDDRWANYARLAMLGMGLFGTLFSIYLTYVEIWVIEAVCIWCLSSAVLIALLMLLSVQPANEALDSIGGDN